MAHGDVWEELRELLLELTSSELPDIASKARRALLCYNKCVVGIEDESIDYDDDDLWDFDEDY